MSVFDRVLSGAPADRDHAHTTPFTKRAGAVSDAFKAGLGMAVAAGVAGVLGHGAGRLGAYAEDSLTFDSDFNKMVQKNPDLKRFPPDRVKDAFKSVRHFSIETSQEPLAAGTAVMQILRNVDPQNPHGTPRVDIVLAKTIAETGKVKREHSLEREWRDLGRNVASNAAQHGMRTYENEHRRQVGIQDEADRYKLGLKRNAQEKARAEAETSARDLANRVALVRKAVRDGDIDKADLAGRHPVFPGYARYVSRNYDPNRHSPEDKASIMAERAAVEAYASLPRDVRDELLRTL